MVTLLVTCAKISAITREKKKKFADQIHIVFSDGSSITVFDPDFIIKCEKVRD